MVLEFARVQAAGVAVAGRAHSMLDVSVLSGRSAGNSDAWEG
jgi:hypothetical protein